MYWVNTCQHMSTHVNVHKFLGSSAYSTYLSESVILHVVDRSASHFLMCLWQIQKAKCTGWRGGPNLPHFLHETTARATLAAFAYYKLETRTTQQALEVLCVCVCV